MARRETTKKSQAAQNLDFMHKGCTLTKVRGTKQYPRYFKMDDDYLAFSYTGSTKIDWARKLFNRGPDMSKVLLSDVQDVREGPISDTFVKAFDTLGATDEQCFSVVVGAKHQTLDLVAPDTNARNAWCAGLKHLLKKLGEADLATQQDIWMRELFKYADKNGDGTLTLKEIIGLLKHLNIEVDMDQAKTVFEKVIQDIREHMGTQRSDTHSDKTKKGEDCLDMEEFVHFYRLITDRDELNELFHRYNYDGKYLNPTELKDFLRQEQHMKVTEEDCSKFIQEHEPCPNIKEQNMMSIDGFNSMLNSVAMSVFRPECRVLYQDMTRPMSDYWIDSSHNTYLTADQLVGPSAVEAYIRALKRGCRCVELDCWDGPNDDPIIYHGYTLTSKIRFEDVIQVINAACEAVPDFYPVILSIENHCSVEQQDVMARYMKNIFKDKLYTQDYGDIDQLPSPESLKGKIIVKAKKLPPAATDGEVSDEDEAADLENPNAKEDAKKKKKNVKIKLSKELSDTVTICQSVHFNSFDETRQKYNCKQMSSFSEGKTDDLIKTQPREFIKHNQFQISRIYPGGLRTDSSNYDPVPAWNCGCQIVALNYQTPDDAMQVNKGKFQDNGGCGYILKPDFLLDSNTTFNPEGPYPTEWRRKMKVKIISGYQLPKRAGADLSNILDPYVKIDIFGVPAEHQQTQKTEVKRNNGFHPVWNETFEFDISCPDLCMVRFRVMDDETLERNVMVAYYCLPFNCIQPGYRVVPLQAKHGDPIWGAQLLVHISFT